MSNIAKIQEGATVLQEVDVSDIFTSLAMGIADAQKKLDDNSIAQITKLAETKVGDKSLLQLGFAPAFYSFTYADINASIHLKMKIKDELSVSASIDFSYASNKGFDRDDILFMNADSYDELNSEFKSSKTLSFSADESKSVSIQKKQFSVKKKDKVKSKFRLFKKDVKAKTNVDFIVQDIKAKSKLVNRSLGVDVWLDSGYLRVEEAIHYNKSAVGLLKIKNRTIATLIDLNVPGTTGSFNLGISSASSFEADCLQARNANGASTNDDVYGISKEGKFFEFDGTNYKEIPSDLYFKSSDDEVLFGESLKNGSESDFTTYPTFNNKNHDKHILIHQCLRFIHQHDENAHFTITGETDPVGGKSNNNDVLAKRRAESMGQQIFGESDTVNVTFDSVTSEDGNSDLSKRKASITLESNYIIFINGNITDSATPNKDDGSENKFIYVEDGVTFNTLEMEYGETKIDAFVDSQFSNIVDEVNKSLLNVGYEKEKDRHYFLQNENVVKMTMFSEEGEEIFIDTDQNKSSSGTEQTDSFVASNSKNAVSSQLDQFTKNNKSSTVAFGANVDFRMAKQFEMSVEGNSSMSARMVALPPPDGFVAYVKSLTE